MKSIYKTFVLALFFLQILSFRNERNENNKGEPPNLKVSAQISSKSTTPGADNLDICTLQDHELNCEHGLLSQFKVEKVGLKKYKINYKCLTPNPKKCNTDCKNKIMAFDKVKCSVLKTPEFAIDQNNRENTDVLGRLQAQCPDKSAMKTLRVRCTSDKQGIYLQFTCCPAKTNACGNKFTSELSYTKDFKKITALERFDIGVPDEKTQAMTGYYFEKKGSATDMKLKVEVRYCSIFG